MVGKTALDNPCDNSPSWPVAPSPSTNPLATMAWANNAEKDKFGCTRTDSGGAKKFHAGIDLKASVGTDCYSVEDAKVTSVGYGVDLGKWVAIKYTKGEKTYGVAYCHLSEQSVVEGASIAAGAKIGKTGKTGNVGSDEPHLHLEIQDSEWVAYSDASSRSKHGINPNSWVSSVKTA